MEGRAKHDGPEYSVFLRIGGRDGAVFIDLGDAQWRAVKVTGEPQRWEIVDQPPVKFIRPPAMRPLRVPVEGGKIEEELRDLVNVRDEADFKLFVAFLIGCFNTRGTYPILAVNGEQGSAKTTLCKLAWRLTDPNAAPLRMLPHNMDELIVMARNGYVLAFDNVSDIPNWLSDGLCSIASGGGHATGEHYSNFNEVVFEGYRPVMLNGIPDLGLRPDFADRTVHVALKPIAAAERRSEAEYWREVEARLPLIFGAMLDAIAGALHNRDTVPPPVTRMADFETWVCAAEPALGWEVANSSPLTPEIARVRSRPRLKRTRSPRRCAFSSIRRIGRARPPSC